MKKKPKKLTEVQKLRKQIRELREERDHFKREYMIARDNYAHSRDSNERDAKFHANKYEELKREKDTYYRESNQKTTKIARLERAVTSLKEGAQKILLGFDTLG